MKDVPGKIAVSLKYYLLFYIAAGNKKEEQLEIAVGSTLGQLLEMLSLKYGEEFSQRLWGDEGELLRTAWILKNGKRLDKKQVETIIDDGDVFIITTPMLVGG